MEKRIVTVLNLLKRETAKLPLPWVTELAKQEKKPYLVLIAALLSVRTKDNTTKRASQRLFTRATTPQEMLELGYRTIAQLIYPVGFYHQKAENILRISQRYYKSNSYNKLSKKSRESRLPYFFVCMAIFRFF